MITINKVEYKCLNFEKKKEANAESLKIEIEGEFPNYNNTLYIGYKGKSYFGYKILPKIRNGITKFSVYIYQEGDSELE